MSREVEQAYIEKINILEGELAKFKTTTKAQQKLSVLKQ